MGAATFVAQHRQAALVAPTLLQPEDAGGGEGENEMGVFMSLASDNSAALVKAFLAEMP